jgi:hypothetical protein
MNLSKEKISSIKHNIACLNRTDLKKVGIKGSFTYEQFIEKIQEQNNKCYVCQQEFKYDGGKWCYFFPSPDRINNRDSHTSSNIAISCLFCNIRNFKKAVEKKCGLCEGLNHEFKGDIITKSALFRRLRARGILIRQYIDTINKSNECENEYSCDEKEVDEKEVGEITYETTTISYTTDTF